MSYHVKNSRRFILIKRCPAKISSTFQDLHQNSRTFQAWKMNSWNPRTFQVFQDLYEPCTGRRGYKNVLIMCYVIFEQPLYMSTVITGPKTKNQCSNLRIRNWCYLTDWRSAILMPWYVMTIIRVAFVMEAPAIEKFWSNCIVPGSIGSTAICLQKQMFALGIVISTLVLQS